MTNRKVYILLPTNNFDQKYSIATIAKEQYKHFGKGTRILGTEGTQQKFGEEIGVDFISLLDPFFEWDSESKIYDQATQLYLHKFENEINVNSGEIILITHDLSLFPAFLPIMDALVKFSNCNNKIKIINWVHSTPPNTHYFGKSLYKSINKNFIFVFPDEKNTNRISEYFRLRNESVKSIPNYAVFSINNAAGKFLKFSYDEKYNFVSCFPSRIAYQKGIDTLIRLCSFLKKHNVVPLFYFIPSYSQDSKDTSLLNYYEMLIQKFDVQDNFIIVKDESSKNGMPYDLVQIFHGMSDFYISASITETFSLSTLEAARNKCVCILNNRVKSYHTMCEEDAYYIDFESNEFEAFSQISKIINQELEFNKSLRINKRVRTKFNYIAINQRIESLLSDLND